MGRLLDVDGLEALVGLAGLTLALFGLERAVDLGGSCGLVECCMKGMFGLAEVGCLEGVDLLSTGCREDVGLLNR